MTLSEPGCYCGVMLSAMIARRLYLMDRPSLTFFNGLLLLYFTIDTVMGALETFFSFQLYKERLILHTECPKKMVFSGKTAITTYKLIQNAKAGGVLENSGYLLHYGH